MITAKVKWWSDIKGFGYLDADGRDVFAHYTAIEMAGFKTLEEGQTVLVAIVEGPKGPQAGRILVQEVDSNLPHDIAKDFAQVDKQELEDAMQELDEVSRFMEVHADEV